MCELLSKAYDIANNADVLTLKDCAVFYSVSYMPNNINKTMALELINNNKCMQRLDDTFCGKALINLGLEGRVDDLSEEITNLWKLASKRFILQASGNVNAFVDGADIRSTFCSVELKLILENKNITTINQIDKKSWAKEFKPQKY